MVIGLLERFKCMKWLFLFFSISFKHDFHVDAESMIEREKCQIISANIFDFTARKFFCREDLSIFIDHMINY